MCICMCVYVHICVYVCVCVKVCIKSFIMNKLKESDFQLKYIHIYKYDLRRML